MIASEAEFMGHSEKTLPVRLLVVDDDEDLLVMMAERFKQKGMKVLTTTKGTEALELVLQGRIDIVLLDVGLPDVNGLELLTQLKESHPDMEVNMLTAHGSIESAIQAMRSGAYDYLTKPFHFNELEVHIQKAYEKVKLARRERQWVEQLIFESPRYKMVGSSPIHQRVM